MAISAAKKRKDKICIYCSSYISETKELEGECLIDEDINSFEFCECFEKKGKK